MNDPNRLKKNGFTGIQFQIDPGLQRKMYLVAASMNLSLSEWAKCVLVRDVNRYPDPEKVLRPLDEVNEQSQVA